MSLATFQQTYLPLIEESLQKFIDSLEFGSDESLKHIITYHMGWEKDEKDSGSRGKRIRPLLMLLCAGALDEDIQKVMPAAVSIELLHNFTLIHDDIEDHSPFRHGRPTIWKKWGIPQAINAGDALFSIAQMSMLKLGEIWDERIAAQAAYKLNQTSLQLTRGQYFDLAFENSDQVAMEIYLEMITGKTAALIALATSLSGIITSQSQRVVNNLAEFGESLGMAFQIQDDALGIWGDPIITGKSTESDISTRKKTLPIIYGLKHSSAFHKLWKEQTLSAEQIKQMTSLLEECGAKQLVQEKVKHFTEKSINHLEKLFPRKNKHTSALFELSEQLINRKY